MTWWVETYLLCAQTGASLAVLAETNLADHLFMSWSYLHPTRHPIFTTIRGVLKPCGYKYIWDTPTIVEQDQAGDTTAHRFYLPALTTPSTIWFYLWAPAGPYGLEIQSPLHRADLAALPPHPDYLQWLFNTNMEGWVQTDAPVIWFNDGSPLPGCLQLGSTGTAAVESPTFDTSWAPVCYLTFKHKSVGGGSNTLAIHIWTGVGWALLTTFYLPPHGWTASGDINFAAYKSAVTKIRFTKYGFSTWYLDTINVDFTP